MLVLVLAHTPKEEARGIAGWYGQFGAADAVIMLSRHPDDDQVRVATVTKAKNGSDGARIAFRLEEVELGRDDDGDPITSCVVAFGDAPIRKASKTVRLGPSEIAALKALNYIMDHGDTLPAPPVPGVRPGTKAVLMAAVRARAMASGFCDPSEKRNTVYVRWSRTILKLIAVEKLRQEGDLVWAI